MAGCFAAQGPALAPVSNLRSKVLLLDRPRTSKRVMSNKKCYHRQVHRFGIWIRTTKRPFNRNRNRFLKKQKHRWRPSGLAQTRGGSSRPCPGQCGKGTAACERPVPPRPSPHADSYKKKGWRNVFSRPLLRAGLGRPAPDSLSGLGRCSARPATCLFSFFCLFLWLWFCLFISLLPVDGPLPLRRFHLSFFPFFF